MSEKRTSVSRQNGERVVQCRMEFTVLSEGRPSHYTSTEFTPLASLPSSPPQALKLKEQQTDNSSGDVTGMPKGMWVGKLKGMEGDCMIVQSSVSEVHGLS